MAQRTRMGAVALLAGLACLLAAPADARGRGGRVAPIVPPPRIPVLDGAGLDALRAGTPPPTDQTVSTCIALRNALEAIRVGYTPKTAYTVRLDCGGTFNCFDPSLTGNARFFQMIVDGNYNLTIKAADGCTSGDSRPILAHGTTEKPTFQTNDYINDIIVLAARKGKTKASLFLENIQFMNGDAGTWRFALYAVSAPLLSLNNVDIMRFAGPYEGAGLYAVDTHVTIVGGAFVNNTVKTVAGSGASAGAAIDVLAYSFTGTLLDVTGTRFENNQARDGGWAGAVEIDKQTSKAVAVVLKNCQFVNNAGFFGEAIASWRDQEVKGNGKALALTIDLTGSTFTGPVGYVASGNVNGIIAGSKSLSTKAQPTVITTDAPNLKTETIAAPSGYHFEYAYTYNFG